MTSMPNLIAVQDSNIQTAGAIVWWKLRETTDVLKLSDAWQAAGLDVDLLPPVPTAANALKRAMKSLVDHRRLVRPLGDDIDGYGIVDETASANDLDYRVRCTAKVDALGNVVIEPPTFEHAATLMSAYRDAGASIARNVIGGWLAELAAKCHAVSLRSSGGIYFIPRAQVHQFRTWVDVFAHATENVVFEVPALRSDEAVSAILDALQTETSAEMDLITAEIASGELGKSALHTRETRCEGLRNKLRSYAELLGSHLDGISTALDSTKANVVAAAMMADAD